MAVDQELLEILCCPETRQDLKVLQAERIAEINQKIAQGGVKFKDGKDVKQPLQEALITADESIIYRVDDEIPVMLVEMGIPTGQLGKF